MDVLERTARLRTAQKRPLKSPFSKCSTPQWQNLLVVAPQNSHQNSVALSRSVWAASWLLLLFFCKPNSRDLSWCCVAQKLTRTQTHTPPESQLRPGGSALQTVLCRFATQWLHWSRWEMSVGGKREHFNFFFRPRLPTFSLTAGHAIWITHSPRRDKLTSAA